MPWEIEEIYTIGDNPVVRMQMPDFYLEILKSSDLWDQLQRYIHEANRKEAPMSYREAMDMINEIKGVESKINFIAVAAEAESEEEAKLLVSREFKNMVQTMPPEEIAAWVTKFAAIASGGWHYHIELDIPFGRSD